MHKYSKNKINGFCGGYFGLVRPSHAIPQLHLKQRHLIPVIQGMDHYACVLVVCSPADVAIEAFGGNVGEVRSCLVWYSVYVLYVVLFWLLVFVEEVSSFYSYLFFGW